MELYLQKKNAYLLLVILAIKIKYVPLSYGIISISQKNSAQLLEREVSLQNCLPLLTTFFALKIPYGEYYLYLKVSFQETKNFSWDRQPLKLIKWKIRDKTGHLAFAGKKD